jgi:hypothetical protein
MLRNFQGKARLSQLLGSEAGYAYMDSTSQVFLPPALQAGKAGAVNLKFWAERRGSGGGSEYCSPRKHMLHVVWD